MNTAHEHVYKELIAFHRHMGKTTVVCTKSMNQQSATTQWTFYQLCVALRTSIHKNDLDRADTILKGLLRFLRNQDNVFGNASWKHRQLTKAQCDAWNELVCLVKAKA